MKPRAAVIDTNVVVAGLLTRDPDSPTARTVDAMLTARFVFLLSTALLTEYRRVLLRPRIQELHRLKSEEVDQILTEIVANAVIREPTTSTESAPEPGDQHLWNLITSEPGTVLVTGDQKLLSRPPRGSSVLSPATFLERLGRG
jgi:putative PIN family toxin of toxin-antitoxin system